MAKYIYLINLLDNITTLSTVVLILTVCLAISSYVYIMIDYTYNKGNPNQEDNKLCDYMKSKMKLIIALIVMSATIVVAIPDKKTMTYMVISENLLTKQNYITNKEEAKDLIDYTLKKLNELK